MGAISEVVRGWGPSFSAMRHDVHVREVNQGGNYILTAIPVAMQAMWTGSVMGEVADASTGAVKGGATFLKWAFNPLVCAPVALLSAAVKEGFYESSIEATLPAQVKHFRLGAQVPDEHVGTITLQMEGSPRHFLLGNEVTDEIEHSVEVEEEGVRKFYYYQELQPGQGRIRGREQEVVIRGERRRVDLWWETTDLVRAAIKIEAGGQTRYYKRGLEVKDPMPRTVMIRNGWERRHYLMGEEIAAPDANSVTVTVRDQEVHYELGKEQAQSSEKTRTFTIDGKQRHFLNAKSVSRHTYGIAEFINKIPKIPFKLPRNLGMRQVAVAKFIAENLSTIIRVITAIACATLFAVGSYYVATGVLLAIVYRVVDHDLGLLPRKVSLFMEKWMPIISLVGLVFVGSLTTQVMSAAALICYIPAANKHIHRKLDYIFRIRVVKLIIEIISRFVLSRQQEDPRRAGQIKEDKERVTKAINSVPLLEECDAPLVEQRNLNFAQITEILAGEEKHYEINPAHCTAAVKIPIEWREDHNFDQLTQMWDQAPVGWIADAPYSRLLRRLADDKRFITFCLQKRFPEAKRFSYEYNNAKTREENTVLCEQLRVEHRQQIEIYIQQLAQEKGQTKQQFVADWVRQQLVDYVKKLKGIQVSDGSQVLLQEAIENTSRILPFLTSPDANQVDREDALVKLAIEGGNYCTLAMKRASDEVFEGFSEPVIENHIQNGNLNPIERMDFKIKLALQKTRLQIIQRLYGELASELGGKETLQDTAFDVHLYNTIARVMKRGFYLMTKHEEEEFSITDLMLFETIGLAARSAAMEAYKEMIKREMNVLGINRRNGQENHILFNLRAWVQQNEALSPQEKEQLLAGALMNNDENLADPEYYEKIHRLQLMILGVYRKKAVAAST